MLSSVDQVDLSGFEVVDSFQEFLERAPQAIETDNGESIVWASLIEQSCQAGPFKGQQRLFASRAISAAFVLRVE